MNTGIPAIDYFNSKQPDALAGMVGFVNSHRANFSDQIDVKTPISLIKEITGQISEDKTSRIGVMFTFEWALYLKYHGWNDVTLLVTKESASTKKFCELVGIKYKYLINSGEDMKFDIVVGNPPFQKTFGGERKAKRYNLWSEFLLKSMELSDNIGMIIPDGWLSSSSSIPEKLVSFGFKAANIGDCGEHFNGVAVSFTYVLLEKNYSGLTQITNAGKVFDVDMSSMTTVTPDVRSWSLIQKLTSSPRKMGWRRGRGYHTSNHKDILGQTGKVKVIHTNPQTFFTNTSRGDVGLSKVVSTISGYFTPHYDDSGDLGVTQATMVLETSNPSGFRQILESKLFRYVMGPLGRQQGWINLALMKKINYVDPNRDWTDKELYEHFNLTSEEIELIESSV